MTIWLPNFSMRSNSPLRSMFFSQAAMAAAGSGPMPGTRCNWAALARRMAAGSAKCSSNWRARTGPMPSMRFKATKASRASTRRTNRFLAPRASLRFDNAPCCAGVLVIPIARLDNFGGAMGIHFGHHHFYNLSQWQQWRGLRPEWKRRNNEPKGDNYLDLRGGFLREPFCGDHAHLQWRRPF